MRALATGATSLACGLVLAVASVAAQRTRTAAPIPVVLGEPLAPMGPSPCEPPFRGDHCPPPPGAPGCEVREHAASRDGSVSAELVEDGHHLGLMAVHLVVRVGALAFRDEHVAERGVGCGTFEMFSAGWGVQSIRVADVLHGRRPEVIIRATTSRGPELLLCSTDVLPPVCVRGDVRGAPRFRRPDLVIAGAERYRFAIAERAQ